MQTVTRIEEVRRQVAQWHRAGERVAFVPTMGNLHAGHVALVARARELAPRVVVSVFVNPTQFVPGEDFDAYPRTPEDDGSKLAAAGTDLLFMPPEAEMYPRGRADQTWVDVPGLSDILCGAFRPGHFRGVATVVAKLFGIVQPEFALFGEKDYQQLAVLRRMAEDLCLPVDVVGVPTVRETDGLAMSSRNGYLSAAERALAPEIYRTLSALAERLRAGERDYPSVEREAMVRLDRSGFRSEYVSIRSADLREPGPAEARLVVLVAARLGRARLIDNLTVTLG
jgi:pantoate--beta-alanine ligase